MHPLDGSRLKVVRAQKHLDDLGFSIRQYLDTNPYNLVVDDKTGSFDMLRVTMSPPLALSAIAGDCVGNLRAALDYIAWELAARYASRPLIIGKDRPYFPLYDAVGGCSKDIDVLSKVYSIPAAPLGEIAMAQPCNARYKPLSYLHLLVNQDKHRLPLLTIGVIRSADIGNARGRIWFVGTDLPAFTVEGLGDPQVDMNVQATGFVAFEDVAMPREPVTLTLANILECVADIVPRFEPFF